MGQVVGTNKDRLRKIHVLFNIRLDLGIRILKITKHFNTFLKQIFIIYMPFDAFNFMIYLIFLLFRKILIYNVKISIGT